MSLLSHDELRIFIAPQQIELVRLRKFGTQKIIDVRVVACPVPAPGEASWHTVMMAIEVLLNEFHSHKANVTVVLSNHFVRYALIQHLAEIHGAEEEQALIHHYYGQVYGSETDKWQFRLNDSGESEAYRVAAAVDRTLLESLEGLFAPSKLVLVSIQPYLMSAFNTLRREIDDDAWFVLVEQGILCLGRLAGGVWRFLRTVNSSGDWLGELGPHLLRAKVVTKEMMAEIPIYVYAPGDHDRPSEVVELQIGKQERDYPLRLLRAKKIGTYSSQLGTPLYSLALPG